MRMMERKVTVWDKIKETTKLTKKVINSEELKLPITFEELIRKVLLKIDSELSLRMRKAKTNASNRFAKN
jgi:hypothetical protein